MDSGHSAASMPSTLQRRGLPPNKLAKRSFKFGCFSLKLIVLKSRDRLRLRSVRGSVQRGVPAALWPWAPECPKSVPRVSRSVKKVSRTLRGHSRDTFWTLRSPGAQRAGTPLRKLSRTPPFSGTPSGTLRAARARETPVAGRGGCKQQAGNCCDFRRTHKQRNVAI